LGHSFEETEPKPLKAVQMSSPAHVVQNPSSWSPSV
jgi:hypothetical protein